MRCLLVVALSLGAVPLAASAPQPGAPAPRSQPLLQTIAGDVRPDELRDTIDRLVGFGTRHTLSDTKSATRGIGAARRWVEGRFGAIGRRCGGCLKILTPHDTVTGERVPKPTEIVDVIAVQRGSSDPDRVIVISGHIDSRVNDVMDAKSDAPGADDDGSGTATVIEAARILSAHRYPATLVFAVLSGEEQGLYGGKLLAHFAREQGWNVEAVLNNDIVGNTKGTNGIVDDTHVRVFSEGTRSTETEKEATQRRYNGGEVDSPSRNLARFVDVLAQQYLRDFDVRMIYRTDRYSRGGDQVPMLAAGFPAVRFTEAIENYHREHQDVRKVGDEQYGDVAAAIDYGYLAQVARLNAVAMAALAMAPAPPLDVTISGAVTMDTTLSWSAAPGAASYDVWWRETTAPEWTHMRSAGAATTLTLKDVNIDDWFFGVSSVSADGYSSPIEFPGAAGAFAPPAQPKPAAAR